MNTLDILTLRGKARAKLEPTLLSMHTAFQFLHHDWFIPLLSFLHPSLLQAHLSLQMRRWNQADTAAKPTKREVFTLRPIFTLFSFTRVSVCQDTAFYEAHCSVSSMKSGVAVWVCACVTCTCTALELTHQHSSEPHEYQSSSSAMASRLWRSQQVQRHRGIYQRDFSLISATSWEETGAQSFRKTQTSVGKGRKTR